MPKVRIPLALKLGASGLLLVFVLSRIDGASLFHSFAQSDPSLNLIATLVALLGWGINTFKWQILLVAPGVNISFRELLRLNFVGIFYNLVLPGQVGGEIVKGVQLTQRGISKSTAALSIGADRVTSLLALLVLGLSGAFLSPSVMQGHSDLLPWLVGAALVLVLAAVVLVTGRGPGLILSLSKFLFRGESPAIRKVHALSSRLKLSLQGPCFPGCAIALILGFSGFGGWYELAHLLGSGHSCDFPAVTLDRFCSVDPPISTHFRSRPWRA